MNYILDCHCHTIASGHAYSTINEIAKQASEKGLELIAITDHAPKMPGSTHLYYFQNLKILPDELYGVKILKGAEVNILNNKGEVDLEDELLEKLDIVIASVHLPCYDDDSDNLIEAYINVMKNPDIDIIGHPDDSRYPVDYKEFVKNAKKYNTLIELNNSSFRPFSFRENAKENYRELLEICKAEKAPIIINTDTHFFTEVGNFEYAEQLLKEIDFPDELIVNTSIEKLLNFLN